MHWFHNKSICSLCFVWNQTLSLKRDELRPSIESSFFSREAKTNGQFSLGYTILMHWFHEKSICSLLFVWIQNLSIKHDEHHLWIESRFFSWAAKTNGLFSLGYMILMPWFREKCICSFYFIWNQSLFLKWDELRLWIESSFFL